MIISHRGNNNHDYKENTIDNLIASLNTSYIDGVEMDVRITKDKKIVLNHDMICDGHIIKNTLYKNLKLDLLDNFLKKVNNKKIILIEIKSEDYDLNFIKQLNKVIKKYDLNYYIFSFNYKMMYVLKKLYSKYKVGLLVSKVINKNKDIDLFDFIAFSIKSYRKINKETFVWTIQTKDQYLKFKDKNIFIITDKAYLWYNLN